LCDSDNQTKTNLSSEYKEIKKVVGGCKILDVKELLLNILNVVMKKKV